LKHGQLDAVIPRGELKEKLSLVLEMHQTGGDSEW